MLLKGSRTFLNKFSPSRYYYSSMSKDTKRSFKFAAIQLKVTDNKSINLKSATEKIKEASLNGAKVVALPECFNCPYGNSYFPLYCEETPGETYTSLSKAALDNNVYVIGGTIPEKDGDKLYNTCFVFSPEGKEIAKFRKVHLFDIDVPNKITFKESDTLTPGNHFVTFETPYCRIGIIICYDIRFPELSLILSQKYQCKMICAPGAFNMTTGPAHWELLLRSRALDNQIYVSGISPARDENSSYIAWGHSTIVNPWGQVISKADEKETIIYSDIDLDYLDEVRDQIPVTKQRRNDMYEIIDKTK